MNDRAPLVFVIAAFSFCTLFPDFIGTILAGIFYGLGKDQECSINAKAYLLAYIIVKVFLILCRLFSIGIGLILRNIVVVLLCLLIWFAFLLIYYGVILSAFFGDNNDCKDKAHDLYIGMLIIAIEAILIGSVFGCIGGFASCCLACGASVSLSK